MATYAIQGPPHAGAAITTQAPGGTSGDFAPTGQGVGLLVVNNGGTAVLVQLPISPSYDGLAVATRTFSVPVISGAIPGLALIPLPSQVYGTAATAVNYSVATQVQVAVVTIP